MGTSVLQIAVPLGIMQSRGNETARCVGREGSLLDLKEPQAMPGAIPGERAFLRAIVVLVMLMMVALAIVFAVSPIPSQAKSNATAGGGMLVGRF